MSKVRYLTAANTDAGGHSNEDSFLLRNYKSNFLAIVSDGVGGLESGELASGFIKRSFDQWFDRNLSRLETLPIDEIKNLIHNEVLKVHENLLGIAEEKGNNFGATLTLLFAKRWDYIIAQVGDSRLYLLESGKTKQMTTDQTVAEYERVMGKKITNLPEERKEHVLMQCMGQRKITPEFTTGVLEPEYAFLLCSDGLSNTLSLDDIDYYMSCGDMPPKDILTTLTAMARDRKESDNITSIMIRREKVRQNA